MTKGLWSKEKQRQSLVETYQNNARRLIFMLNTAMIEKKNSTPADSATIHIILADSQTMVREGLRNLLDAQTGMIVIEEAADGRRAVEQAQRFCPQILIADVTLGRPCASKVTAEVRRLCPETRVIALGAKEQNAPFREMMEAGASAYVLKRSPGEELIRAVRTVAAGGVYLDPALAGKILGGMVGVIGRNGGALQPALSDRETEALSRIACGYSSKEIAAQLSLSVKTVETYKSRSMKKLDLNSRVDLIRFARDHGWFDEL